MVREGAWVWGEGLGLAGTRDLEVDIRLYNTLYERKVKPTNN